jgi:hypothetical protein
LVLVGLDVGQLLGTGAGDPDLTNVSVLELRHCTQLPGDVISKLTGLQDLRIRESPDLSLPEQLTGLSNLKQLDFCGHRFSDKPPVQYGCTVLPACVGALSELQHLRLENLPSLTALPATLSGLGSLTAFEVTSCGIQVPEAIGELTQLKSLSIRDCPRVTTLPSSISALRKLESLVVTNTPLVTVPAEIGGLRHLEKLELKGCDYLVQLPNTVGRLQSLRALTLNGCGALTAIPGSIGGLQYLTSLQLQWCTSLVLLPSSIVDMPGLETLDVSYCRSLHRLPALVGQLKTLKSASIKGCGNLPGAPMLLREADNLADLTHTQGNKLPDSAPWNWSWIKVGRALGWKPRKEWTPAELLRLVVYNGARQAVITKLVREQGAMLTTLERLSWLVVLLATATFMAYMQPPGGFRADTNLVMATEEMPCWPQLPGLRGTGNYTQEQVDFRKCAAGWFFVLDGLSFTLR